VAPENSVRLQNQRVQPRSRRRNTKPGHISHDYADHVSILKFIERNWSLPTIPGRSRDNLPNPTYDKAVSVYAPTNNPAISDLFDPFNF